MADTVAAMSSESIESVESVIVSEPEPVCKICFQTKMELAGIVLLSPCRCTDPICQTCLEKHMVNKTKVNPSCEICLVPYTKEIVCDLVKCRPEPEPETVEISLSSASLSDDIHLSLADEIYPINDPYLHSCCCHVRTCIMMYLVCSIFGTIYIIIFSVLTRHGMIVGNSSEAYYIMLTIAIAWGIWIVCQCCFLFCGMTNPDVSYYRPWRTEWIRR